MLIVFDEIKEIVKSLGLETRITIDKNVLELFDSIATNICNKIVKQSLYIKKNNDITENEVILSTNIWLYETEDLRSHVVKMIEDIMSDRKTLVLSYKYIEEKYLINKSASKALSAFIEFIFAEILDLTINNISSSSRSRTSSSRSSSNIKIKDIINVLYKDEELKIVCGKVLYMPSKIPTEVLKQYDRKAEDSANENDYYGGSRDYFISCESIRKIGYKVGAEKLSDLSCEELRGIIFNYLEKYINYIIYWAKYKNITVIKHSHIQDIYSVADEYFVYTPDYPNAEKATLKDKKGFTRLKYYNKSTEFLLPIDSVKYHILRINDRIDKNIKYTKPALKLLQSLLESHLTSLIANALHVALYYRESKQVQPKDFQIVKYKIE